MARGCWSMYYRESGKLQLPPDTSVQDYRKAELERLADADPPAGIIGYVDGTPAGWVAFGPRSEYTKLRRSPIAKPVDDQPVWSIVCFVVPSTFRHQGVARGLLAGAIDFARERGVGILEAYPIDREHTSDDTFLWNGPMSMFAKAGFVEVARRRPDRPVVRLQL